MSKNIIGKFKMCIRDSNIGVPVPLQIPAAAVVAFGVSWLLVVFIRKISGKNAKYLSLIHI